ncbi:MAG TPA: hypothetical protein PKM25_17485, partial [Candidatus Ozemobacteraceae bacterium]|nr:hypothetical protein [Candidatus Ozemobacteraceae bacterium]
FIKLPPWQMPLVVVGFLLAISVPSVIIAWLKLRQRNLGPILDANGWAINSRLMMSIAFGGSLTRTAHMPPGSRRTLEDPFADAENPWPRRIIWLLILTILILGGYRLHAHLKHRRMVADKQAAPCSRFGMKTPECATAPAKTEPAPAPAVPAADNASGTPK